MKTSAQAPLFVFLASFAILLAAYGFQFLGDLEPCELCYWQRYPYYVAIPLSFIAVLWATRSPQGPIVGILMLLCSVAFFTGAAIAGYHVGVEQGWWQGPQACGASSELGRTAEEFLETIKGKDIVRCDEVPWSFLGISMAGYNFIFSVLLGLIAFVGFNRRSRV
ncbi:MAG: disulfide bond formation protein B [Alphaproteobacteria bacterium]|nr:disulfide bond formation protein B [Alphaproteobacteria bacterium]